MNEHVKRLSTLYRGLGRAHGQYTVDDEAGDGKQKGVAITHKTPPTPQLWHEHVQGDYGLGIIPIDDLGMCYWGVIDIDVYPVDHDLLESNIAKLGLPLLILKSKSNGAHLAVFFKTPVPAKWLREKLLLWCTALNYPSVERFPKQNALANQDDVGNWLNMPYHGGTRRLYHGGKERELGYFLDWAETLLQTVESVEAVSLPENVDQWRDAPPCLQTLVTNGFGEGSRNEGMFNLGIYFQQAYPDDWEARMFEANNEFFDPPLSVKEVSDLSFSLARKQYFYKCKQAPISEHCNKSVCRTRKYGVGAGDGTGQLTVEISGLSKLNGDPPIWYLTVDGYRIELGTEELMRFDVVKRRCMDALTRHIGNMKQGEWDMLVQQMMNEGAVDVIHCPEDAGMKGHFKTLLVDFLTAGVPAQSRDDLLNGRPWYNEDDQAYYLRAPDLLAYLRTRGFYSYSIMQIFSRLRDMGATDGQLKIRGKCVRYWALPMEKGGQTEEFDAEYDGGLAL